MMTVRPVIATNGVPYLQIEAVRSCSTPGKEEEEGDQFPMCFLVFSVNAGQFQDNETIIGEQIISK